MCQSKTQESTDGVKKLYLRGTVSNSAALLILYALCQLQEGMAVYVGIAVGEDGTLVRTMDGGYTWEDRRDGGEGARSSLHGSILSKYNCKRRAN